MPTITFYPNADPETTSVDGEVAHVDLTGKTWADLHVGGANGGSGGDDDNNSARAAISSTTNNKWKSLFRIVLLFDTSALPNNCTITNATLSVYGSYKIDTLGITPTLNVYTSDPASDTELAGGDYNSLGTTALCDTAITYANFKAETIEGSAADNGWNHFALNATGLATISKTGITKLGLREATYDVTDTEPAWTASEDASFFIVTADESTTPNPPKLVVTYTTIPSEVRTSTLRLLNYDCRGIWYPTRRIIIQCTVLCGDDLLLKDGSIDTQTGATIKAAIEEARDDATWPITFYDIDGSTVYVKVLSARYRMADVTKERNKEHVFDLILLKVPLE